MERLPGRNVVTVDDLPGPVGPLEDSVTTDHIPVDVVGQLEPEVKFVSESTTETITQPLAAQFPTVCEPSFPLKINMQTKMHFLFSHTSLPLQVKNLQRILLQKNCPICHECKFQVGGQVWQLNQDFAFGHLAKMKHFIIDLR